jgi:hypothetical protein
MRGGWDNDGFEQVWSGDGFDGEPLVDIQMLQDYNILSLLTRTSGDKDSKRDVVVLDFVLNPK